MVDGWFDSVFDSFVGMVVSLGAAIAPGDQAVEHGWSFRKLLPLGDSLVMQAQAFTEKNNELKLVMRSGKTLTLQGRVLAESRRDTLVNHYFEHKVTYNFSRSGYEIHKSEETEPYFYRDLDRALQELLKFTSFKVEKRSPIEIKMAIQFKPVRSNLKSIPDIDLRSIWGGKPMLLMLTWDERGSP